VFAPACPPCSNESNSETPGEGGGVRSTVRLEDVSFSITVHRCFASDGDFIKKRSLLRAGWKHFGVSVEAVKFRRMSTVCRLIDVGRVDSRYPHA